MDENFIVDESLVKVMFVRFFWEVYNNRCQANYNETGDRTRAVLWSHGEGANATVCIDCAMIEG